MRLWQALLAGPHLPLHLPAHGGGRGVGKPVSAAAGRFAARLGSTRTVLGSADPEGEGGRWRCPGDCRWPLRR